MTSFVLFRCYVLYSAARQIVCTEGQGMLPSGGPAKYGFLWGRPYLSQLVKYSYNLSNLEEARVVRRSIDSPPASFKSAQPKDGHCQKEMGNIVLTSTHMNNVVFTVHSSVCGAASKRLLSDVLSTIVAITHGQTLFVSRVLIQSSQVGSRVRGCTEVLSALQANIATSVITTATIMTTRRVPV